MKVALEKLLNGRIENQADYLHNIIYYLGPLYSEKNEKMIKGLLGKFLLNHPSMLISAITLLNRIFHNNALTLMLDSLTGCSLDVLNQFFASDFIGFNLIQQIQNHHDLYSNVTINLISCSDDHIADPNIAIEINRMLPDTSSVIILRDKHQARGGPSRDVFNRLLLGLLCENDIPADALKSKMVDFHHISMVFTSRLRALSTPVSLTQSTANAFRVLSVSRTSMERIAEVDTDQTVEAAPVSRNQVSQHPDLSQPPQSRDASMSIETQTERDPLMRYANTRHGAS
jgi:hypothetical protein